MIRALPNLLSVFRLTVIPFIVIALYWQTRHSIMMAAALFILACLSDTFDGALARVLGMSSRLGAVLDYTADKLLIIFTFMSMALFQYVQPYDIIPIYVIIFREVLISGLREFSALQGVMLTSDCWGKVKTTMQMVSIIAILGWHVGILSYCVGSALLWGAAFFSIISFMNYSHELLKKI